MSVPFAWVFAGGVLGTIGRFWLASVMSIITGPTFPWGTLLINIFGSFAIGLLAANTGPGETAALPSDIRIFLLIGVCGGFTTFSSFSLQTIELVRSAQLDLALIYVFLSTFVCLLFVWAGAAL